MFANIVPVMVLCSSIAALTNAWQLDVADRGQVQDGCSIPTVSSDVVAALSTLNQAIDSVRCFIAVSSTHRGDGANQGR